MQKESTTSEAEMHNLENGNINCLEIDLTRQITLSNLDLAISQMISENEIVMFSKSSCAYCFGESDFPVL